MAELSEQTEAIIERLRAEGQLVRNTGTNSLKSVSVKMDKFEGLFKSINNELMFQTDVLREALQINKDRASRAEEERQLQEVAAQAEAEKKKNEDPPKPKPKPDESKTLGGVLGRIFGNIKNFFTKSLLAIGGGILGFEFLRGFIDERTDGAFTKFFDDVDWAGMTTAFVDLSTGIKAKVDSFLNFLNDPLGSILNSNAGQAAAGVGVAAVGAGLYNILKDDSDDDDKTKTRQTRLKRYVRFTAMGLVSTGVLVAGEQVKNWINDQEWSDKEIAGIKLGDVAGGGVDLLATGASAYTMAMMFGLGPYAIPAALAAVAIKGLVMIRNYIERKSNEFTEQKLQEFENNLDAALDAEGSEQVDNALAAYQAQLELLNNRLFIANEERAAAIAAMNARDTELMNALIAAREFEVESMGQGESAAGPVANAMEAMNAFETQGRSRQSVLETFLQNTIRSDLTPETIASLAADGLLRGYLESMVDPTQNPRLPSTIAGDYATRMGAVDTLMAELVPMSFNYGPQNGRRGKGSFTTPTDYSDVVDANNRRIQFGGTYALDDRGNVRLWMYDEFGDFGRYLTNYEQKGKLGDMLIRGTNLMRDETGKIVVIQEGDTNITAPQVTGGTNLNVQSNIGTATPSVGSEFPGYAH